MKAIVLTAYGDVDKLEARDLPDPKVGRGEIMVRMAAAGLNPVDWKLRDGSLKVMMPLALPAILGRDVSGEVVEIGEGVTGFQVGDRVMGLVTGAYAELIVAPADAWARVPSNMELMDAAALPLALLTGAQLVEEALAPQNRDVILITGATGSVGRVAVFTAKAKGATVWAGVKHIHRTLAAKLGVEGVVSIDDDAEIASLPELDGIVDTVGGETIIKLLGKVKSGGIIATAVGGPPSAKERGLVVHGMMTHPDSKRLEELAQAVAHSRLSIPIARRFPLSEVRAAQSFAEKGGVGKVILTGPTRADRQHKETVKVNKLTDYVVRDSIMKLLTDDEIARVSTAETVPRLSAGDEYIDLERLERGVLRADGFPTPMGRILPRAAVREATWARISGQLTGAFSKSMPLS